MSIDSMVQRFLYCMFLGLLLLGGCVKQPATEGSVEGNASAESGKQGGSSFFDSLRVHSPLIENRFAALQKSDPVRWQLVTDLLAYYYSLRWSGAAAGTGMNPDDRIISQRLKDAPSCWKFPEEMPVNQAYASLRKQSESLIDFPVEKGQEEHLRQGLQRFMERYLALWCKRQLDEFPKNASLARALEEEQLAWRNYLKAETAFYEQLNAIQNPDRFSALGMRLGEFKESRRLRREEADRVTCFALTSPSYQPPFADYVTWTETQQEYSTLQARLLQNGMGNLRDVLLRESYAWFAFAKARTTVEDLLSTTAKSVYATGTRTLKKYHLNDLKTW